MLRTAAERLPDRLVQADLRALPLRNQALDGIWCVAALLHVPDEGTEQTLQELCRILSPGGAIALVTALGHGYRFEQVPYAPSEQRWFVYRSRDQIERQLENVGLRIEFLDVVEGNRVWLTTVAQRNC